MLKKLTALSLSLLICLSLLPGQAGAMDASDNEPLVQAENVENLGSSGDNDAGAAPCRMTADDLIRGGTGGDTPPYVPIVSGGGKPYGPEWP